jgi:parallel beta-helix repeat protein
VAVAGDVCSIGSGTFTEAVTFPRSGSSGNPITVQGAGTGLTIVDGSVATDTWVAAPEVGTGVFKRVLGFQPFMLTTNNKMIQKISNRAMNGELLFGVNETGFAVLAKGSNATAGTAFGTVQFWDGVEALYGYQGTTTYLRFRTNVDPDTMNVRAGGSSGVFALSGRSWITLKHMSIRGGRYGVHISGGGNNIIENTAITHGAHRILLNGGTSNNIIRNNSLIQDGLHTTTYMTGDHSNTSYARTIMRHQYNIDKFFVGETTENSSAIEMTANVSGNQITGNTMSQGAVGLKIWESTNSTISGNTFSNFGAQAIWAVEDSTGNIVTDNLFVDNEHHMRMQVENPLGYHIYANRFFNFLLSGKHIHFSIIGSNVTAPATVWVYQNSFAGGGWATDLGFQGSFGNIPNIHILNNIISVDGFSSTGSTGGAEISGNLSTSIWRNNTQPNFVLPTNLRNGATSLIPRGLPGMTSGYYEDGQPDHGAIQGDLETPPEPPTPIAPGFGLEITANCASGSNSLNASVLGSLFYLLTNTNFDNTKFVQASCASAVTMTDVASVLQPGFPSVQPFHFVAQGVSPSGNTCTNCLSVHNGTASTNEGGSGWTLDGLLQGSSVSAAIGSGSAFLALPGLCKQYRDGTLTNEPLWPWAMNQRIIDARILANKLPVNVTSVAETLFGTLPIACTTTTPLPPPPAPQTTWVIATDGVNGQACTLEAPCATFAHVGSRMGAGHTLYVRGGTYDQVIDTQSAPIPGGTSWGAPTTIAAYGQEEVILQPTTGSVLGWFRSPTTDHFLVLDRFVFDGSSPPSTQTNGLVFGPGVHHIRVQNSRFRNMRFEQILVEDADNIEILNNIMQDNVAASAIKIVGTVDGLVLQGNTISGSGADGILMEEAVLTNAQIVRNTLHTIVGTGLWLLEGAQNILVANNLIHSSGVGVRLGSGARDIRLYNNTIADNTGAGLLIDAGASDTLVTNNIVFGNDTEITDDGTDSVLTTNLTTDPGFVGSGSYKIASGASPAVDAGTDVAEVTIDRDGMARPTGQTDIGAYDRAAEPVAAPGALRALPYQTGQFLVLP